MLRNSFLSMQLNIWTQLVYVFKGQLYEKSKKTIITRSFFEKCPGFQSLLIQNITKTMKKKKRKKYIKFTSRVLYLTYKFCEDCMTHHKFIKNWKTLRSKGLIQRPCSKHAVLEGKINLISAKNQEKYFDKNFKKNRPTWRTYEFAEQQREEKSWKLWKKYLRSILGYVVVLGQSRYIPY